MTVIPKVERAPALNFRSRANREIRRAVMVRQDFTCQSCYYRPLDEQIPADYDGKSAVGFWPHPRADRILHVDHIVPRACGGQNVLENLQVLCEPCNVRKGHRA